MDDEATEATEVDGLFTPRIAVLIPREVWNLPWKTIEGKLGVDHRSPLAVGKDRRGAGGWPKKHRGSKEFRDKYFGLWNEMVKGLEPDDIVKRLEAIRGIFNGTSYRRTESARLANGQAKFILQNNAVDAFFLDMDSEIEQIDSLTSDLADKYWRGLINCLREIWCDTNREGLKEGSAESLPAPTSNLRKRQELVIVHSLAKYRPLEGRDSAEPHFQKENGTLVIAPPAGQERAYLCLDDGADENGCPFSMAPWFKDVERIVRVRVEPGVVAPATIDHLFKRCVNLEEADLSGLDVSGVRNMLFTFAHCRKLTKLNLSGWDTGNLRTFGWAFCRCESLTELDLSGWDVSRVWEMSGAFSGCSRLKSVNLTGWDVSAATEMENLFYGCKELSSIQGISDWNTSKARTMRGMFWGCGSLTELDLSRWEVGSVEDMTSMFRGCTNLKTIKNDEWELSEDVLLKDILRGCKARPAYNDKPFARIIPNNFDRSYCLYGNSDDQ